MKSRDIANACGFKTAKGCLAALRELLHGSPLETPLNGSGFDLLSALYANHPKFAPWDPPEQFTVTINAAEGFGAGSRGFVAWFQDGAPPHHFSYRFDQWGKFDPKYAARMAVYLKHGGGMNGCELHHVPPWTFAEILGAWLEALGRPPRYTNVIAGTRFAPDDENAFLAFHDARAVLRHVPVAEHIQIHHPEQTWLAGAPAVEAVRAILSKPGAVGVDFETWPTDPAWHGEQAALRAPRGQKGAAKEQAALAARLGGRALQRQACTLQLHHEDGTEVFVRLTDPARELPAMFEPVTAAAPWDDPPTLISHRAQFETEVLLKHGVAVDVEDTWTAARCLYLVAVAEDLPQPVSFRLKDLVRKEFGRTRDKTVRDRDWRFEESLDDEAVEYGLQDVRDALDLWQLYEPRLREAGLFDGYKIMQGSLLPTAECNLNGLPLDTAAHDVLMRKLEREAAEIGRELDRLCDGRIANHGSTSQISVWIQEEVLGEPIKRPVAPKVLGLIDFLKQRGGLKPDPGGELAARDVPPSLINLTGSSLWDASVAAQAAGYIGLDRTTMGGEATDAGEDELLAAIGDELAGRRVLPLDQRAEWDAYLAESAHWAENFRDDNRMSRFVMRLRARCKVGWRTTKTGHLAVTKGSKLRKAEQLKDAFPLVSAYLVKHAQWNRAVKLLDSFGPTLRRWIDDDGHARGQAKVFGAWTGRQVCVDPNLTNQPREDEFRALWVAKPGRKLVIADYSQIELRLAGIESRDERLLEVYREGRDVHAETASIILDKVLDAVTAADRKPAKGVNFLCVYGGGASKLAETLGCDLDQAQGFLSRFFAAYPGLAKYREDAPKAARTNGWIDIRPGRRVAYIDGTSSPTQAINAPIQGGAASVQMRAIRLTWDALRASGIDCKLAVSVHDEIILDAAEACADEAAALLVDCMTRALVDLYHEAEAMGLARLTEATIADRWSDKQ